MTYIRQLLLLIFILTAGYVNAFSQSISISAKIDKNRINFSDTAVITLEVKQPKGIFIRFPLYNVRDSLVKDVDIISYSNIDSTPAPNNMVTLRQRLIIQAFNSGNFEIGPFMFMQKNGNTFDTLHSNSFMLEVAQFTMDTTLLRNRDTAAVHKVFGIKDPIDTPFNLEEFFARFGWLVILFYFLQLVAFAVWYFYFRKVGSKGIMEIYKPKEPAHLIALNELEKLEHEKLWQQNRVKEFHIRLTEILRKYIENRYEIPALEQTSYEIVDSFEQTRLLESGSLAMLKEMLVNADLVKFAKAQPLADENEVALQNAYTFVKNTKQEVKLREENNN